MFWVRVSETHFHMVCDVFIRWSETTCLGPLFLNKKIFMTFTGEKPSYNYTRCNCRTFYVQHSKSLATTVRLFQLQLTAAAAPGVSWAGLRVARSVSRPHWSGTPGCVVPLAFHVPFGSGICTWPCATRHPQVANPSCSLCRCIWRGSSAENGHTCCRFDLFHRPEVCSFSTSQTILILSCADVWWSNHFGLIPTSRWTETT